MAVPGQPTWLREEGGERRGGGERKKGGGGEKGLGGEWRGEGWTPPLIPPWLCQANQPDSERGEGVRGEKWLGGVS